MPDDFRNCGRRCLNSPEFSVEVVDETTMKAFCAHAAGGRTSSAASRLVLRPMAVLL
jgi:hypothetical protein